MRLTPAMKLIEATDPKGRKLRAIIRDTYTETGSLAMTAERLGISEGYLSGIIKRLGGEIRSEVVFPRRPKASAGSNGAQGANP